MLQNCVDRVVLGPKILVNFEIEFSKNDEISRTPSQTCFSGQWLHLIVNDYVRLPMITSDCSLTFCYAYFSADCYEGPIPEI